MRKISFILIAVLLMATLMLSCSDDDNSVGSSSILIHARGFVMLNPYLTGTIHLNGVRPALLAVDSVTIADSAMYLSNLKPSDNLYRPDLSANYSNRGDSLRIVSGDIVPISIYTPSGNSYCDIPALSNITDSLYVVEGSIPTSVPQYGFFTVHWHPVPQADWYLIERASHGPGGPSAAGFAVDTLFQIDSLFTQFSSFGFYIQPVIGPLPTSSKGNITGGPVVGSIYGTTWGSYVSVQVESSGKVIAEEPGYVIEKRDPIKALDEFLDKYQE